MIWILAFVVSSMFTLIALGNKHNDKSRYFVKGYVDGSDMGYISYEHPQVVKSQLDLLGNRVNKTTFDVPMTQECFIRDCTVMQNDTIAVINSQKQLIIKGKSEHDMEQEMMNYYE